MPSLASPTWRRALGSIVVVLAALLLGVGAGCSSDAPPQGPHGFAGSGGTGSGVLCPTTFHYQPPAGTAVASVAVAGEWNSFDKTQAEMQGPDASGGYDITLKLEPGFWGYKLVLDGDNWQLDPEQGYRKYVDGTENSAVEVPDCTLPSLKADSHKTERSAAGAGHFTAEVSYVPPVSGTALDPKSVSATLRYQDETSPVDASALSIDAKKGSIGIDVGKLPDGKYTIELTAADTKGKKVAEPLRLVFWVEADPFEWRDALIYMIVTDRFKDGDPSNNAPPTPGVQDPRTDWKGGDLQGVRASIAAGTLDQLGVRALWLTPYQTNPQDPYLASDGTHRVTGYHGYWPIRAREVDPRIGGAKALHAMVTEAHKHGIRVLMDFVVNHVHKEHEYFSAHPDWFRTGCVCGTSGCDWTSHRLSCLFADYLPDVNWTVTDAAHQIVGDAVWWLDTFDLDGLRVDAVKHVEEVAVTNLSTKLHNEFEAAGTRYFLTGETAMGWNDCGSVACNADQYDPISSYIGTHKLDGQFDFVLYHAVPYRVFANDNHGLIHADFWTKGSLGEYPKDAIMTPFIGSHDTARFITLATYRGQPGYDGSIPGNQWTNVAGPPPDVEPYQREELALSWLLTLPGAPLLYYGDEYGQWGGVDPGNRAMWRGDSGTLSANEKMELAHTQKLGQAREQLVALRRGDYETLLATDPFLAYARVTTDNKVAIVALSKNTLQATTDVPLPASLPLADGTTLHDRLGGPDVTVSGGHISVTLGPWGSAILAP